MALAAAVLSKYRFQDEFDERQCSIRDSGRCHYNGFKRRTSRVFGTFLIYMCVSSTFHLFIPSGNRVRGFEVICYSEWKESMDPHERDCSSLIPA
jgi:hypothetical protein